MASENSSASRAFARHNRRLVLRERDAVFPGFLSLDLSGRHQVSIKHLTVMQRLNNV